MSFGKCDFKILIIFIICSLKFVACDLNNSKKILSVQPRVTGGYRSNSQTLAKYIVSLRYRDETEKRFGYMHFCAGSIIASNKILTAAHCLFRNGKEVSPAILKVVAKTPKRLNKTLDSQEVYVKKVIIHSKYEDDSLFNDIALLILEENILLDSKFAAKILLPTENIESGVSCQVFGWGRLYMHGPLANEILHTDLHLHSRNYCRKILPKFSGKKICASNIYDKEKDACVGDSGGPLICKGVVTGIVSYGYGCALGNAAIYTNVFKYLDWIQRSGYKLHKPCLFIIAVNLLLIIFLK